MVEGSKEYKGLAGLDLLESFTQAKEVLEKSEIATNPQIFDNIDDIEAAQKRAHLEDTKTDTALKKKFADWFIGILICQLAVMNIIFILIGCNVLKFSDLTIQIYMGGTLTEVFGIVFIMCRYLFSKH